MRIDLTIYDGYVPTWGLREGLREVLQNALDGEREGCPLRVEHDDRKGRLMVANVGARVDRKALLTGYTTKAGRVDLAGQFGEGLKLGLLALLRSGCPVRITNDDEDWRVGLRASAMFEARVLSVTTVARKAPTGAFAVAVDNVSLEHWQEIQRMFLRLVPPEREVRVSGAGSVILDADRRGHVYSKGIYVCKEEKFAYGYDFDRIEVDRDRSLVRTFDLEWQAASVWREAMAVDTSMEERAFESLAEGRTDCAGFRYDTYKAQAQRMSARFVARYGKNAVHVADQAQAEDLSYAGATPILTNDQMRGVLDQGHGTAQEIRAKLLETMVEEVPLEALTAEERAVWDEVVGLLARVDMPLDMTRLRIVEFSCPTTLGQYVAAVREARVSRTCLDSFRGALEVIVHELSHVMGSDRSAQFADTMAYVFSSIIEYLVHGGGVVQRTEDPVKVGIMH